MSNTVFLYLNYVNYYVSVIQKGNNTSGKYKRQNT